MPADSSGKRVAGVKYVAEPVEGDAAVHEPASILPLDRVRILCAAVVHDGHLADQGAHHVAERDHAFDFAVLVHHQRNFRPVFFQGFQQAHRTDRFRHEQRGLRDRGHVDMGKRFAPDYLLEQVAGVNDADDLRPVTLVHGKAAVGTVRNFRQIELDRVIQVDIFQVGARRHQRSDAHVIQAQCACHDVMLGLLEHAGVCAFLQHPGDFFFGDRIVLGFVQAQQPQEEFGGDRQHLDKGSHDAGQQLHRRGNQRRHGFRVLHCDTFRNQFAQDDGRERNAENDNAERNLACVFGQHGDRCNRGRESLNEGSFAEGAVENADQGNADLHCRQKAAGAIGEMERGTCAPAAILGELLQPHPLG